MKLLSLEMLGQVFTIALSSVSEKHFNHLWMLQFFTLKSSRVAFTVCLVSIGFCRTSEQKVKLCKASDFILLLPSAVTSLINTSDSGPMANTHFCFMCMLWIISPCFHSPFSSLPIILVWVNQSWFSLVVFLHLIISLPLYIFICSCLIYNNNMLIYI